MKRKYKRRTSRFGIFFVFLTAVTIAGVFFIPWAMKPDNFRNEKNKINSWLNGIFFQDFYNAKSLILVDLSNDNIFISKRENEQQRDYPEFCVTAKMRCKIELIFQGGSGVGCARLVYNITPTGAEVKGHPRPLGSRRRRSAP